jgi:hypothetical protein
MPQSSVHILPGFQGGKARWVFVCRLHCSYHSSLVADRPCGRAASCVVREASGVSLACGPFLRIFSFLSAITVLRSPRPSVSA